MIEPGRGDMLRADVEALVNTVNCVGVMGRGVALQFKKAYPANFAVYEKVCERGGMKPGRMLVFETGQLTNPKYIINFPTKRHWRGDSRLDDVEAGLADLVAQVRVHGIRSIAIPPLGCGLGGPRFVHASSTPSRSCPRFRSFSSRQAGLPLSTCAPWLPQR